MPREANFLVASGFGINCERESAQALELAGLGAHIVHLRELWERPSLLSSHQGLFLPGGFSYGDDLGAGRVLALTLEHYLKDALLSFVASGKPILGVCNGLQVLAILGLVPGDGQRAISLIPNRRRALHQYLGGPHPREARGSLVQSIHPRGDHPSHPPR